MNKMLLYLNLINIIVKYLDNDRDIYFLSFVNKELYLNFNNFNKYFKEKISKEIFKEINHRLQNNYFKDIQNILYIDDAIVSGSFLIQCILNEDWDTDLDIFLHKNSIGRIHKVLCHLGNCDCHSLYYDFDDSDFDDYDFDDYDNISSIGKSTKYKIKGRFVDIVDTEKDNNEKLKTFLLERKSLTIWKNIYYINKSKNKGVLYVDNIEDIMLKRVNKNEIFNTDIRERFDRKYRYRGFKTY